MVNLIDLGTGTPRSFEVNKGGQICGLSLAPDYALAEFLFSYITNSNWFKALILVTLTQAASEVPLQTVS